MYVLERRVLEQQLLPEQQQDELDQEHEIKKERWR